VNGEFGSKVTPQDIGSGSRLASVSDVLKPDSAETSRTSAVVALFEEDGTYGPYAQSDSPDSGIGLLDRDDTLIQGLSGTPTIEVGIAGLRDPDAALSFQGDNTTVESVRFVLSETDAIAKLSNGTSVVDIGGKGTVFNSVDIIAARPFDSEEGYARVGAGPNGSNSFSDGSVSFDGCTFALRNADGTFPEASDADSNGQAFLGGNPLFGGTGNTLEVVNSTFRGGIKLDCNLDDSTNTMRVEDCVFEEEAVDETIGGGVDSGSLTVANNDFRYALTGNRDIALFDAGIDPTNATINGDDDLDEQEVANRLASANEADTGGRNGRTPKVQVDRGSGNSVFDTID
jgi:hypothetical protein